MKIVKFQHRLQAGASSEQYGFTVPSEIGSLVVAAGVGYFTAELTEDGILFRPSWPAQPDAPTKLPAWLKP